MCRCSAWKKDENGNQNKTFAPLRTTCTPSLDLRRQQLAQAQTSVSLLLLVGILPAHVPPIHASALQNAAPFAVSRTWWSTCVDLVRRFAFPRTLGTCGRMIRVHHINAPSLLAAVSCEPPQRKPVTPATVALPESSVCGNPHTGVMCSMSTGRYVATLTWRLASFFAFSALAL